MGGIGWRWLHTNPSTSGRAEEEAMREDEAREAARRQREPTEPLDEGIRDGSEIMVAMTVTQVTGLPTFAPGTVCRFGVQHFDSPEASTCHARVTCDDGDQLVLHGHTQGTGFFHCPVFTLSPPTIAGADDRTSAADDDPSFVIDSASGAATITDDASGRYGAFSVTGTIRLYPNAR